MAIVGILNPKGGTGKTTLAIHLATAAFRDGINALLIDTDKQGSCVDWYDRSEQRNYNKRPIHETRSHVVREESTSWCKYFELAVVDGAAGLESMAGAVLAVSDVILIPVQPTGLDLWGTEEFMHLIEDTVRHGDAVAAFVPNRQDVRSTMPDEFREVLDEFGFPVLDGLTQRISYGRSITEGRTVFETRDAIAQQEVQQLLDDIDALYASITST